MRKWFILIALILMIGSACVAFTRGQVSDSQGNPIPKRNIVYIHVPNAFGSMLCFAVVMVAGVGYLKTRRPVWDHLGVASVEVGLLCATIMNITGSIFARAEWNVWWTTSPRLVSSALLWFLYVGYVLLRSSIGSPTRRNLICAVYGIIAFLDVPLVYATARFIPDIHRKTFSFGSTWQYAAFWLGAVAVVTLAGCLISLKTDLLAQQEKVQPGHQN